MQADDAAHAPTAAMKPMYGPHPQTGGRHPSITAYVDILTEQHNFAELSEADVKGMTCKAMRELLAHRGLKMTGGKASLRERLLTMQPDVASVKNKIRRAVCCRVSFHIREYGEDGMGDKPAHMDTVDYWLAHFNPGSFANA
jgi:hypothetical protein